ncbi:MAG: hypothetical protein ABIH89_00290 [Elusimicrobiota bacterium]
MNSKVIIIFPYGGYEHNKQCEYFFWWTVDKCKELDLNPIVVLNRDTVINNKANSFVEDDRFQELEVIETWAVDTCQMWLIGWGYVLDRYPESERIIQIPGDIDYIDKEDEFYQNLGYFIKQQDKDITIGDFRPGEEYSAKGLVDTYGTYALLANWFPEISKSIRALSLNRPRSEFINFKASVLHDLLKNNRKFAYEQTLNFIIKSWNFAEKKWKYSISVFPLGTLSDERSFRQYSGSIDQIERTERILALLWREIKEPEDSKNNTLSFEECYKDFSDEYDKLYNKSKGIVISARTTLRAFLGV